MSNKKILILIFFIALSANIILSEDCSNFNGENSCQGSQTEYPSEWNNRKFQTPPRNDPLWRETYQDMHLITGYISIKYNNKEKTQATLTFETNVNTNEVTNPEVIYYFGDIKQSSNTFIVSNQMDTKNGLPVRCELLSNGNKIAILELDEVYFFWNLPKINLPENYQNGQKGAIIELFGWPYDQIEKECEFVGKAGYLGVKVFPPQEAILSYTTVENGELNPWFFIYQPVSYKLTSRHGTRQQFKSMIDTCRSNNVRVYADAVVNHMTGNGNDMNPDHRNGSGGACIHWGSKNGSAGSPWYTHGYQFQNNPFSKQRPGLEFPSVPYDESHFHCERVLNSWTDPFTLNYGWLVGLTDLNTENDYVRQRIADYMTDLISIGVSGIRMDAAKHISPKNISYIFKKLKDNLNGLNDDFIAYLEVIVGGEKDLLVCNEGEYNFAKSFENTMLNVGLSQEDVDKIKIWSSDYPKEFPICGYWPIKSERYAIGLDCHDDQFPGSSSRDMGDAGSVLVKEKNVDKHRSKTVEMFTRTDGNWKIKLILSSYTFVESKNAFGFPDGHSDCSKCQSEECKKQCTKSVPYSAAFDPNACGYSMIKDGKWEEGVYTRVHRDTSIINAMRSWMGIRKINNFKDLGLSERCFFNNYEQLSFLE